MFHDRIVSVSGNGTISPSGQQIVVSRSPGRYSTAHDTAMKRATAAASRAVPIPTARNIFRSIIRFLSFMRAHSRERVSAALGPATCRRTFACRAGAFPLQPAKTQPGTFPPCLGAASPGALGPSSLYRFGTSHSGGISTPSRRHTFSTIASGGIPLMQA